MEQSQHTKKRILLGLLVIAAGMAVLLSNIGILNYEIKHYLLRWPLILVAIGLVSFLSNENGRGIILLAIGSAFYIREIFVLPFNFWQFFIPVILILLGILIIFKSQYERPNCKRNTTNGDDFFEEIAIFGGGDRNIVSQNFSGGKLLAIFGGSNFNFLHSKLAPGNNYIDVLAIFGGLKMVVPDDWTVKINVVSLFGGFSDKHHTRSKPDESSTDKQLIIKGIVIFGGGEIRSF